MSPNTSSDSDENFNNTPSPELCDEIEGGTDGDNSSSGTESDYSSSSSDCEEKVISITQKKLK